MQENTDQKTFEFGRFLSSVTDILSIKYVMYQDWDHFAFIIIGCDIFILQKL